MGLKKQKIVKGYPAEYWRINQYTANFDRNDAVITLSLYKDKATRDADPNAVVESFQCDLGEGFHAEEYNKTDSVKNIKLSKAYSYFKSKAVAESQKEDKDESLAWFADAIEA